MRKVFFTPGPSELFFTYPDHLRAALKNHIGSISHRSKDFGTIFQHSTSQIRELLNLPSGYHIVFTTSATEIWERSVQNLITKSSHHFVHGSFGKKMYQVAKNWNKEAILTDIKNSFHSEKSSADLIALTMNETSTGFQHNADDLIQMRQLNPDALISLDVVSCVPGINVDFSQVDSAFLSAQKCFGMPAGLGVWIVNERAIEIANKINFSSYHSLPSLLKNALKNQTPSTPNVLGIYLIGKIAEDMNRRGINTIQNETNYKAAILYQALENHPKLVPSISEKKHRSKTTIVGNCIEGNKEVLSFLQSNGLIVGKGYAEREEVQIRIANFPAHSKEQVELLCDSLESFS